MSFDPKSRATALWSTEAAAACGLSHRLTPAQLWAQKRGLSEQGAEDYLPARLGLVCQDGVAQLHRQDTGDDLVALANTELRHDVKGVRMGSHYDFLNRTLKRLHEVKFFALSRINEFGEAGTDVVPMDVLLQCLHQMIVWNEAKTGYPNVTACEVDVVFGNVQRAIFVIPYDLEAVDKLLQKEAQFQALVDTEQPPEPTSPEDARRIWSKADGSERVAAEQTLQVCSSLRAVKAQIKKLEAQESEMALYIQRAMETASTLKSPDGRVLATWSNVTSERVDVKRLRAEMPKIAEQYATESATRRFLLKG
jgi:predicted phage-related endonuclease